MRLLLLSLMMFIPLSATAHAKTPSAVLHNLSNAVREAQKQSSAVEEELQRLETEEETLTHSLMARRYQAVKAYHALQVIERSPEKHIYLLPDGRYQHRFHSLRRAETLNDILVHLIENQTQAILDLRNKQATIRDYQRRRDMLALTIDSALHQIKDIQQNKDKVQEFQVIIEDIKAEAESLDSFLQGLLNLPPADTVDNQPLIFTLPVSGIVKPAKDGIYIEAASQALVTTPARGQIAYAGQFKPLGNIIIINHGQGYISVLKNLGEIYVEEGFIVRDNDPVGILSVDKTKKSDNNSMLYYELRYNHTILNPIEKMTGL